MLSENEATQFSEYKKFIGEADDQDIVKVLESKKSSAFLGGEEFVSSIKKKYFPEKKDKEIPESSSLAPDLELIRKIVSEYYEIAPMSLYRKKRRIYNEPRDIAIYMSRYLRNDSLKQICTDYLLGSESSVSSILNSINELIKSDSETENKIAEIRRLVTKREIKT